jgi:hypothetical protein
MQNCFSTRHAFCRRPQVESLEYRRLLSATKIVDESFGDGVADQFDLVWSNAQSAEVVTENSPNSNRMGTMLSSQHRRSGHCLRALAEIQYLHTAEVRS